MLRGWVVNDSASVSPDLREAVLDGRARGRAGRRLRERLGQGGDRGPAHGQQVPDRADLLAGVLRAELIEEVRPLVLPSARRRRLGENGAQRAHVRPGTGREAGVEAGLVVVAAPKVAPGGADERFSFEPWSHGRDALVGADGARPLLAGAVALGHPPR